MTKKEQAIFKNGKNTTLYPIFLKCIEFTEDDFWKSIFENISVGKCPKGIYITNGYVYLTSKKRGISYLIPDENSEPKEAFNEFRNFIMDNTSICSNIDIKNKKKFIKNKQEEITDSSIWTNIRKKTMKELYIINFCSRMKKEYNLTMEQTEDLFNIIQLGFIYKTQSSSDVVFKNKKIDNIKGITYCEEKKMFVNKFGNNMNQEDDKENNDLYMYYYWNKYVISSLKNIR